MNKMVKMTTREGKLILKFRSERNESLGSPAIG